MREQLHRPLVGGFTLLEVMVAVTILSISLTAIFSSEAAAIRAGARARQMTSATLLARCKMAEVEEHLARDGLPAVSESGEDECCEGGELPGFRCEWDVERVELPDAIDTGEEGDPTALAAGLAGDHAGDTAGTSDVEAALTGAAGGDAIGSLAIQAAFPVLRPFIEDQVRRVTVTVLWGDAGRGTDDRGRSLAVSQYIVGEQGSAGPEGPGDPPPANP